MVITATRLWPDHPVPGSFIRNINAQLPRIREMCDFFVHTLPTRTGQDDNNKIR